MAFKDEILFSDAQLSLFHEVWPSCIDMFDLYFQVKETTFYVTDV